MFSTSRAGLRDGVGLVAALLLACGGGGSTSGGGNTPPPPTFAVVGDAYTWLGNSRIAVPAVNGVLANDPAGTVITGFQNPSARGGTVSVDLASGAFSYEPPAPTGTVPFAGADT